MRLTRYPVRGQSRAWHSPCRRIGPEFQKLERGRLLAFVTWVLSIFRFIRRKLASSNEVPRAGNEKRGSEAAGNRTLSIHLMFVTHPSRVTCLAVKKRFTDLRPMTNVMRTVCVKRRK